MEQNEKKNVETAEATQVSHEESSEETEKVARRQLSPA